jgi:hypothetical protein
LIDTIIIVQTNTAFNTNPMKSSKPSERVQASVNDHAGENAKHAQNEGRSSDAMEADDDDSHAASSSSAMNTDVADSQRRGSITLQLSSGDRSLVDLSQSSNGRRLHEVYPCVYAY